jgi:hypothetical protein
VVVVIVCNLHWQELIRSSRLPSVALAALLSACNIDRTGEPYAVGFVGHCSVSVKEAIFVSRECSKGAWKYCDAAEPIGPQGNRLLIGYPPTLEAFHDDPDAWSTRIREAETAISPGWKKTT